MVMVAAAGRVAQAIWQVEEYIPPWPSIHTDNCCRGKSKLDFQEIMSRIDLARKFEVVFRRLLAREEVDLYAEDMSLMWAAVAGTLFGNLAERKWCYFDGVINLVSRVMAPLQVEFTGDMWVGEGRGQRTEAFHAIVTDKTITKQGIWFVVKVGANKAEAELWSAFGAKGGTAIEGG